MRLSLIRVKTWLTAVDICGWCTTNRTKLLHGLPEPKSARKVIWTPSDEAFYTVTRPFRLEREFRCALLAAFMNKKRVIVVIAAHGFEKNGGCVALGGKKFYKSDLEAFVSSHEAGADVTLLSNACHSGLFVSEKWTAYLAASPEAESLSFSESGSGRFRGSPWAAVMDERIREMGAAGDPALLSDQVARRTVEEKSIHAIPQYTVAEWDKPLQVQHILEYQTPGLLVSHVPRDAGNDHQAGSISEGSKKRPNASADEELKDLVHWYEGSNYPDTSAPSNHGITILLYLFYNGKATESNLRKLKRTLAGRKEDDQRANELLETLGITPEISITEWEQENEWASHSTSKYLEAWVTTYDGYPYRKPMLFVLKHVARSGISEKAFKKAVIAEVSGKRKRDLRK